MVTIGNAGILAVGKWRWLRALAWMAVLGVLVIMAINVVADATLWTTGAASGEPFTTRSAAPAGHKLAGIIAGAAAALATYWCAVRFGERRPVPELRLRPILADSAIGLAIGGGAIALVIGVQWAAGWVTIAGHPISGAVVAVRESIESGVFEELLFRLILFRLVWRAFGVGPALAASAALFGLVHLSNPDSSWFAALSLIAGEGMGIGLYMLTGRIWASIGMHAAWNFVQGWVFGAAVSGMSEISGGPLMTRPVPGVPDVLSGGGFGPEASFAAMLISAAVSLIILRLAWRRGDFVAADRLSESPVREADECANAVTGLAPTAAL